MKAFNNLLALAATQMLWATTIHKSWIRMMMNKDIAQENDTATSMIQSKAQYFEFASQPPFRVNKAGTPEQEHAPFAAETYNRFNTPATKCRLEIEPWQNHNIDRWISHPDTPLVEWVWELTNEKGLTYYRGLLNVLWCGGKENKTCTEESAKEIASWKWTWQDHYGDDHDAGPLEVSDLLFEARLYFNLFPSKKDSDDQDWKKRPKFIWPTTKQGTTLTVYDLEPYLRCNIIEKENPPPPTAKIGACITRFWGQHDLMPEWITYHRMLGIQHFFFFVSEPFQNIQESMPGNETDITYIPYNYTWDAHKEKGTSEMVTTPTGWSGAGGENWFQNAANNQCLHMGKQYGFDWMISPDVDEYIAILDRDIKHFSHPSPLQQYFQMYHPSKAKEASRKKQKHMLEGSQVCLYGAGYGKHPNENPEDGKFELTIDFTWRRHAKLGNGEGFYNGNNGAHGRKKCFYNPKVVTDVGVHSALGVAGTGYISNSRHVLETVTAANRHKIQLMHFRSPTLGVTELPGALKGKKRVQVDELQPDTRVRDMYRKKVLQELKRRNWPTPNFGKHACRKYNCKPNNSTTVR